DVQVLQVDPVRAGPGGVVQEPQREADRLTCRIHRDVAEQRRVRGEERRGELLGGQVALVRGPFERGQLVHHGDHRGHVRRLDPADGARAPGVRGGGGRAGHASTGLGRFQRWITGVPCSSPSRHAAAGPSANSRPWSTGRPRYRAASTRPRWPWLISTTGPDGGASAARARTRSARMPTSTAASPPGGSPVPIGQSGGLRRISGVVSPSYSPYCHSVRSGSGSAASPASSAVCRARCNGLVSTSTGRSPPSIRPSATACFAPWSVSGRSVRLVCRPSRLHSVSPCRTSTTTSRSGTGSAPPPSRPRRPPPPPPPPPPPRARPVHPAP